MKRGLALEGGGAKGAYHIGVAKAFVDKGLEFDGFVGTSIGAVNAAILAQGDLDAAYDLWMNISPNHIFAAEEQPLLQLSDIKELELNADFISGVKGALTKVIGGRGVSTERMLEFLNTHLNEERIRTSRKDFGLVTLSLSERKPYELMLDDIPQGKLIDYIMASASFPGFSSVIIEGKKYLDGGLYNNCPVNLLSKLGYDEIVAVRVGSPGIVHPRIDKMKNVKLISPKEDLGSMMAFSAEASRTNIQIGYYDTLRFLENLRGSHYYIKLIDEDVINAQLMALNDEIIVEAGKILGLNGAVGKRMLFEKIIPRLGAYLKLDKDFDYTDFVVALLEKRAKQEEIERFQVYDYAGLCSLIISKAVVSAKAAKKPISASLLPAYKKDTAVEIMTNHLFANFS